MKKFLKTLVVGLCLFTLLCCALPAAFAADKTSGSKKEENVYAIGMDAQGGICSTVVTYTNLSGKLESTPEQPTMTGYTFDGWYTEPVGGSKVTTSTVFTSDATWDEGLQGLVAEYQVFKPYRELFAELGGE